MIYAYNNFSISFWPISGQVNGTQTEKYSPLDGWFKKFTLVLGYYNLCSCSATYAIFNKLLNLSVPQSYYQQNGDNMRTYFLKLCEQ